MRQSTKETIKEVVAFGLLLFFSVPLLLVTKNVYLTLIICSIYIVIMSMWTKQKNESIFENFNN